MNDSNKPLAPIHQIHLDTGQAIDCDAATTLLEALRAAGLDVRKACRNGVCGLCRCRVVSGEFTYHWKEPHGLWQKDIQQDYILPCIAHPVSDLVLDHIALVTDAPR